ncbi:hypothetical protein SHAM105786_11570 [Shewanella amazonensis]|uniref:Uncharacterized protein n=1 Tax=Shewanella amazonensis (strain ATCC BAA-1098 / SB2B) TaxID=326297 RepID=A1SAB9_SHEAM|nr:hypothetical protein [Shewanella amazonensis]ABM01326.1 hypothetical protein Sama_3123 [Shewanella amazonensis SB2B]
MKYKGYWILVFIIALLISLAFGLAPYILYSLGFINPDHQNVIKIVEPVGGMFGPASAFFSGFALIAVIISIQQQREALKIQAEELELTRKEIGESTEAQQEMAKHQKNAISLQVIMPFMNEISSAEMRKAIIELSKFGRMENFDAIYYGLLHRNKSGSLEGADLEFFETVDNARRKFVGLFHKMQRLSATGVVDNEIVRVVLGPDSCWLLLNIVEPLDAKIRPNYSTVTFDFARGLYSAETVDVKGRHD